MAELKTRRNKQSVTTFLSQITDERRRGDARAVAAMMRDITKAKPEMWGTSIVGFGSYHYKYASGREGEWMMVGFSPRKQTLVLYIMPGFEEYGDLLKKLGKCKTGKSCLYIKTLDDVHLPTLKTLVRKSVTHMRIRGKLAEAG